MNFYSLTLLHGNIGKETNLRVLSPSHFCFDLSFTVLFVARNRDAGVQVGWIYMSFFIFHVKKLRLLYVLGQQHFKSKASL